MKDGIFKRRGGEFPLIMGILNATPDSFSDGGDFFSEGAAVERAFEMLEKGADIIDIGGESTRPGADSVEIKEEIRRTRSVIEAVVKEKPNVIISIDTSKFEVAEAAIDAGASIINDVSGLEFDKRLAGLAAESGAGLVIMHMKGSPRTMQLNPVYENVIDEIFEFLKEKIDFAREAGVASIICDPGVGFGKTLEHNIAILRNLEKFYELGTPILLGVSRKSFIDKIFNIPNPKGRDLHTALIHSLLLQSNALDIIRVHNIETTVALKKLWTIIKNQ